MKLKLKGKNFLIKLWNQNWKGKKLFWLFEIDIEIKNQPIQLFEIEFGRKKYPFKNLRLKFIEEKCPLTVWNWNWNKIESYLDWN